MFSADFVHQELANNATGQVEAVRHCGVTNVLVVVFLRFSCEIRVEEKISKGMSSNYCGAMLGLRRGLMS